MPLARLTSDGRILYPDARALLADLPEILRTAGVYAHAPPDPPELRAVLRVELVVEGVPRTVPLEVEAVFVREGMIGLEVVDLERRRGAIDALRADLEAIEPGASSPELFEDVPAARTPSGVHRPPAEPRPDSLVPAGALPVLKGVPPTGVRAEGTAPRAPVPVPPPPPVAGQSTRTLFADVGDPLPRPGAAAAPPPSAPGASGVSARQASAGPGPEEPAGTNHAEPSGGDPGGPAPGAPPPGAPGSLLEPLGPEPPAREGFPAGGTPLVAAFAVQPTEPVAGDALHDPAPVTPADAADFRRTGTPLITPAPPPGGSAGVPAPSPPPRQPPQEIAGRLVAAKRIDAILGSPGEPTLLRPGDSFPAVRVLLAASRIGWDVTLDLGQWRFRFNRRGELLAVTTPEGEGAIHALVRSGALAAEEFDELLQRAGGDPGAAERLALAEGYLSPVNIALGLRDLVTQRAHDITAIAEAPFVVRPGLDIAPVVAVSFGRMAEVLVRRAVRGLSREAIDAWVDARGDQAPRLVEHGRARLRRLKLDRRAQRLAERLDGSLTARDAIAQSAMTRLATRELLIVLTALELLTWAPAGASRGERGRVESQLRRWLARIEGADPFTVLGLHWTTHASEVKGRVRTLRAQVGPGSPPDRGSREARELAARIWRKIEAAQAELADPKKRRRARRAAASPGEVTTAIDLLRRQANMARIRGQDAEARRYEELALELRGAPPPGGARDDARS